MRYGTARLHREWRRGAPGWRGARSNRSVHRASRRTCFRATTDADRKRDMATATVSLVGTDGSVAIARDAAVKCCGFLADALEHVDDEDEQPLSLTVPIQHSTLEFVKRHCEKPLNVHELAAKTRGDHAALFALVHAANFLQATELLKEAGREVATSLLAKRSPQQLRSDFGIAADLAGGGGGGARRAALRRRAGAIVVVERRADRAVARRWSQLLENEDAIDACLLWCRDQTLRTLKGVSAAWRARAAHAVLYVAADLRRALRVALLARRLSSPNLRITICCNGLRTARRCCCTAARRTTCGTAAECSSAASTAEYGRAIDTSRASDTRATAERDLQHRVLHRRRRGGAAGRPTSRTSSPSSPTASARCCARRRRRARTRSSTHSSAAASLLSSLTKARRPRSTPPPPTATRRCAAGWCAPAPTATSTTSSRSRRSTSRSRAATTRSDVSSTRRLPTSTSRTTRPRRSSRSGSRRGDVSELERRLQAEIERDATAVPKPKHRRSHVMALVAEWRDAADDGGAQPPARRGAMAARGEGPRPRCAQ